MLVCVRWVKRCCQPNNRFTMKCVYKEAGFKSRLLYYNTWVFYDNLFKNLLKKVLHSLP